MASLVTLLELKNRSRKRANQENSNFVGPEEHLSYINEAAQELYDLLVSAYGENYKEASATFSTVQGQTDYAFATIAPDYYKLMGVDIIFSATDRRTLKRFDHRDRNKFRNAVQWQFGGQTNIRYRQKGDYLSFMGPPQGVYSMELLYVPAMTKLEVNTDTFDGINGWERYIVAKVAKKMKDKQEDDTSALEREIMMDKKELEGMAADRDIGEEVQAIDVRGNSNRYDSDYPEDW